jgi:kynurenine formamidase
MREVRKAITRRQALGRLGAAGAAVALGGAALTPATAARQEAATPGPSAVATPSAGEIASSAARGSFTRIQDLSHVITPEFPMFPGAQQFAMNVLVTIEDNGFYKNELILDEHTGTHMDAPAHFAPDGATAESLPVEHLVAPLVVIDISARAAADPDAQLMPDDILAWEQENGPLPSAAFVAMHSGWQARLVEPQTYINADSEGTPHFPGFHPDAAALLVEERDIVGIGVDTLSLDFGASADFATHLTVLPAGKFGIENLAALASVPPSGATVVVGGPKHINASGGPARTLALF